MVHKECYGICFVNTLSGTPQKFEYIAATEHKGLSTLKIYHGDSMGLHDFFHHSAIISCYIGILDLLRVGPI
jgi:hypothetical protein